MHPLGPRASTLLSLNRAFKVSLPPFTRVSNLTPLSHILNTTTHLNTKTHTRTIMGSTNGLTAGKPVLFLYVDTTLSRPALD